MLRGHARPQGLWSPGLRGRDGVREREWLSFSLEAGGKPPDPRLSSWLEHVESVGSPPLIGCWATTTNGGCHKAMRPGRGLAEWHMLPSWKPPAHPAVCPGKLLWLGLATPRRSALACLRRPEPPTDICSNGHMAVGRLGSIRIQGYVLGGFRILRH